MNNMRYLIILLALMLLGAGCGEKSEDSKSGEIGLWVEETVPAIEIMRVATSSTKKIISFRTRNEFSYLFENTQTIPTRDCKSEGMKVTCSFAEEVYPYIEVALNATPKEIAETLKAQIEQKKLAEDAQRKEEVAKRNALEQEKIEIQKLLTATTTHARFKYD